MPVRALPPQGSASTNFATWADFYFRQVHYARKEVALQGDDIHQIDKFLYTSQGLEFD